LRPDLPLDDIAARLRRSAQSGKPSLATLLRKALKLPPVAVGLLHEGALRGNETLSVHAPDALAARMNDVPVRLTGIAPVARAISTAGGVRFEAVDTDFMLRNKPGVFVAGEMLDWEAPTGGYLLQASFATGAAAARGALKWLGKL
jgi:predicted flavoprotein YhiN